MPVSKEDFEQQVQVEPGVPLDYFAEAPRQPLLAIGANRAVTLLGAPGGAMIFTFWRILETLRGQLLTGRVAPGSWHDGYVVRREDAHVAQDLLTHGRFLITAGGR